MNALLKLTQRKSKTSPLTPQLLPLPDCMGDFETELHRERLLIGATEVFGKMMRDKKANTADAKQKRN